MKLGELVELLQSEPYNPECEVNIYLLGSGSRVSLQPQDIDFDVEGCVEFNVDETEGWSNGGLGE